MGERPTNNANMYKVCTVYSVFIFKLTLIIIQKRVVDIDKRDKHPVKYMYKYISKYFIFHKGSNFYSNVNQIKHNLI